MNLTKTIWHKIDALLLIAAVALAIPALVTLVDLNGEVQSAETLFNDDLPSFSVRAEFDLAMLISAVNEFGLDSSKLLDMQDRYEILVSRLYNYESAFVSEFAVPSMEIYNLLEDLKTKLLDLEQPLFALKDGDVEEAILIREELKGLLTPLSELSDMTRQHQFSQYELINQSLARSVRVEAILLALTLVFGAVTVGRFLFSLRSAKRFNEVLELRVQERTQDLQLSNHELKNEIAERQRAEKALAERDKQTHRVQRMEAVGRITAGVAHDFNNLLAVIMGNIELLMNAEFDQKSKRFLENALSATITGSQLTRKLLAFGKRAPLNPEIVNLNEIVSNLDDFFAQSISENIHVKRDLASDLQSTSIDKSLLENVLLNLISNARDALPSGGVIAISTDNVELDAAQMEGEVRPLPSGDYVQIIISDSGSGMTAKVLEQAIEPFFTTKAESKGAGLGLSMAYGFVQQSNGLMRVSSKPGLGTSVKLLFPVCTMNDVEKNVVSPLVYEPGGLDRKILVVEDSEAVRNTVVEQLQVLGCNVIMASTGHEAYEIILADRSIELLLTDVVMPGRLQGPELAESVLLLNPELKVVFMSGYPKGIERETNAVTRRFTNLMKPLSLAMLSETLHKEFETDS